MQENKNENYEIGEEATRYGEFITSYFAWLPLSVQKEKVEDLENITNNKNKRKKQALCDNACFFAILMKNIKNSHKSKTLAYK